MGTALSQEMGTSFTVDEAELWKELEALQVQQVQVQPAAQPTKPPSQAWELPDVTQLTSPLPAPAPVPATAVAGGGQAGGRVMETAT